MPQCVNFHFLGWNPNNTAATMTAQVKLPTGDTVAVKSASLLTSLHWFDPVAVPKGPPPPAQCVTSEAERLSPPDTQGCSGGLQRRYIITQWITGHRRPRGGNRRVHGTVARHADGSLDSIGLSWLSAALPVGNLIHSGTWGDSGATPTTCRLLFIVFYQRGLSGRQTPPPTPPRAKLCLPMGLKM